MARGPSMLAPMLSTGRSAKPRRRFYGALLTSAQVERIYSWMRESSTVRLQADLARATGINQGALSNYLAGKRGVTAETLVAIAGAFGRSLGELLAPEPVAPVQRIGPVETGAGHATAYAVSGDDPTAQARAILAAEGYVGLFMIPVTTADLMDRHPPVTPGMAVWIDGMIPPTGGRVVCVEKDGQRLLRSLAADGRTLTSAVPGTPPLDLAEVDRVVGVARLAQIAL